LKVLRQNGIDTGLTQYQSVKKDEWGMEVDGFGSSFELIGDDILYNITHGKWKEPHVEQFINLHEKVIREAGLIQKGYFYRIINWEKLEKSTWKARKMYIEGLNGISKKIPCKMAVVFGLNKFMKTLVGISSPFMAYPVMVANDLHEALELTAREREREISAVSAGKTKKHASKIYTEEQLREFANELLQVIGGINWEQAGLSIDGISEEHPLKPVLDALAIVKLDLDYLLQEKENSQKSLSHAEKLVTMGTIVASVAHEINNPNNSLMLDAQFNQNAWKSVSAVLDEHAEENGGLLIGGFSYGEFKTAVVDASNRMKRNTERIKHIVENLRAIAKKEADFDEDVDLNATVRSALSVVEYLTSKYTRNLVVSLGEPLPRVRGNAQCLEQVIINLVKNACQSLPGVEKGVFISTALEPEKNSISFTIRDQGKGMDEKTLKEIFIPFYTTKGKEGTGLGLSISYGLIKDHHGLIGVLSRPGLGSRFSIFLPVDGETRIDIHPAMLCMDHDTAFLNELKMNFIDAVDWPAGPENTPEAIISYLEDHPEIDTVISEIRLPGMDGWELLKEIRERFPLLAVILYSADPVALKQGGKSAVRPDHLLRKPFNISQLQTLIRELGRQRL
jgi:signal transduction histidine kinase/CheY-like chemotaxis protein